MSTTESDLSELESQASKLEVSDEVTIQIKEMHKWYGSFHVLKNINLEVNRGERIVICGPSGSGKSTMIRCINRLEEHQQGQIIVDNVELTNDLKNIDAIRREVGMVFQHFNLFPHLTVMENCALAPIWVKQVPRKEAEATAMKDLERVLMSLALDLVKRTVNDPFRGGFLAVQHDRIHKFGQNDITVFRIRDNIALFCLMAA